MTCCGAVATIREYQISFICDEVHTDRVPLINRVHINRINPSILHQIKIKQMFLLRFYAIFRLFVFRLCDMCGRLELRWGESKVPLGRWQCVRVESCSWCCVGLMFLCVSLSRLARIRQNNFENVVRRLRRMPSVRKLHHIWIEYLFVGSATHWAPNQNVKAYTARAQSIFNFSFFAKDHPMPFGWSAVCA